MRRGRRRSLIVHHSCPRNRESQICVSTWKSFWAKKKLERSVGERRALTWTVLWMAIRSTSAMAASGKWRRAAPSAATMRPDSAPARGATSVRSQITSPNSPTCRLRVRARHTGDPSRRGDARSTARSPAGNRTSSGQNVGRQKYW